jgi:hypothetical protein
MIYTDECVTCHKNYVSCCGEYIGFTKRGWEMRKLQLNTQLCDECFKEKFGEVPERGDFDRSPAPEVSQ